MLELLNQKNLHLPVSMLGYGDHFIEHGPQSVLWQNAGIDSAGIAAAALALVSN